MVKLEVSQEKYINRLTNKTNHSPSTALPPFKDLLGFGLSTAGREACEPSPQSPWTEWQQRPVAGSRAGQRKWPPRHQALACGPVRKEPRSGRPGWLPLSTNAVVAVGDRRWETEQGSCKWKSPWGRLQLDKVFDNKIPETADGSKAQYFSLSTNLLQSYTTPMQHCPQLHAVNNKQIYFHQPCWCQEKSAWA